MAWCSVKKGAGTTLTLPSVPFGTAHVSQMRETSCIYNFSRNTPKRCYVKEKEWDMMATLQW
jgi:hypothetical protein